MSWKNVGDVDPRSGALLFRDPGLNASGDFEAEAAESVSETVVGGDESRLLLRRGTVYLAATNFASALDAVGARLDGAEIVRPGPHGGEERLPLSGPEGLQALFLAAHAYGGIDNVDIESYVQIGADTPYDQPRKFGDDPLIYRRGTSPWTIMARELEDPEIRKAEAGPRHASPEPEQIEEEAPSPW